MIVGSLLATFLLGLAFFASGLGPVAGFLVIVWLVNRQQGARRLTDEEQRARQPYGPWWPR